MRQVRPDLRMNRRLRFAAGSTFHFSLKRRRSKAAEPVFCSGTSGIAPFLPVNQRFETVIAFQTYVLKNRHGLNSRLSCAKYRLRYLKSICGDDANFERPNRFSPRKLFRGGHLQTLAGFFLFRQLRACPNRKSATSKSRPGSKFSATVTGSKRGARR